MGTAEKIGSRKGALWVGGVLHLIYRQYSTFSPKINALPRCQRSFPVFSLCKFTRAVNAVSNTELRPERPGGQSPSPGSDEKNFLYLSGTSSKSLASAGASFLTVIFGQVL